MFVQSVDEIHFILVQQTEHFLCTCRDDLQGYVRKLLTKQLKAVPEEPVTQRVRHGNADMSFKGTGVIGYPSDFIGKSCDLMSQPENFTAFRCQFDRVIDPVEKRKAE